MSVWRWRQTVAIAVLLLTLITVTGARAATPLDPAFGVGGVSISPVHENGELDGIAKDSRGRLVTAGTSSGNGFIVQRFLSDGSLDTSFGEGGVAQTGFGGSAYAKAVAIQADGKIVVAGNEYFGRSEASYVLARYLPNGERDPHFGKRGRVVFGPHMYDGEVNAMAIQPNGRILVAGWSADTHFGFSGILARLRPDGSLDESFSHNGLTRITGGDGAFLTDVAPLPDGKILVAGEVFGRFMMLRMSAAGRADPSFGQGGFAISNVAPHPGCRCAQAKDLALLPDGRILLSGSIQDRKQTYVALARYLPNGHPDTRFGDDGVVRTGSSHILAMEDMAVGRRSEIVLVGYRLPKHARSQVAVLRYLPDGRLDPGFAAHGLFTERLGYESTAMSLLVQPDGTTVIAGRTSPGPAAIQETAGEEFTSSVLERGEFMLARLLR